jgi:hypothetical protein
MPIEEDEGVSESGDRGSSGDGTVGVSSLCVRRGEGADIFDVDNVPRLAGGAEVVGTITPLSLLDALSTSDVTRLGENLISLVEIEVAVVEVKYDLSDLIDGSRACCDCDCRRGEEPRFKIP